MQIIRRLTRNLGIIGLTLLLIVLAQSNVFAQTPSFTLTAEDGSNTIKGNPGDIVTIVLKGGPAGYNWGAVQVDFTQGVQDVLSVEEDYRNWWNGMGLWWTTASGTPLYYYNHDHTSAQIGPLTFDDYRSEGTVDAASWQAEGLAYGYTPGPSATINNLTVKFYYSGYLGLDKPGIKITVRRNADTAVKANVFNHTRTEFVWSNWENSQYNITVNGIPRENYQAVHNEDFLANVWVGYKGPETARAGEAINFTTYAQLLIGSGNIAYDISIVQPDGTVVDIASGIALDRYEGTNFTPTQTGEHTVQVSATDLSGQGNGNTISTEATINVKSGKKIIVEHDYRQSFPVVPSQNIGIPTHIYWDAETGEYITYFLVGYIRYDFDQTKIAFNGVTAGTWNPSIQAQGPGYVTLSLWKFNPQNPPDPAAIAYTLRFHGVGTGTVSLNPTMYSRDGFLSGSVHGWYVIPVEFRFTAPLPSAPSNLVATAVSHNQINLTWQDNSDNEQGFIIERKDRSYCSPYQEIARVGENVNTYSNSGLFFATLYFYRVRAYNQAGESAYSNEAPAITFAYPEPTFDDVKTSLTQYYQKGQIKNAGIYNSLSVKLNQAQSSFNSCNYQDAEGALNALSNQINAQAGKGIDAQIVQPLLRLVNWLVYKVSVPAAFPSTVTHYLTSGECENNVIIKLLDGSIVKTKMVGYVTVNLQATDNPDVATFTIQDSKYVCSSFSVNGIDFGKGYVEINSATPGNGTVNLQTGEINLVERVLLSSSYMRILGIAPIPFELAQKGVLSPINLKRGKVELIGLGTLPSNIPLIGGAQIIACTSSPAPTPGSYHCPPLPGEGIGREDADGDGQEDVFQELLLDGEGNRIEVWAITGKTFRISYSGPGAQTPSTRLWIGACDYIGGEIGWDTSQEDTDGDGRSEYTTITVTNFDKGLRLKSDGSIDYNDDDGDGKMDVTQYVYDPQTGILKVIHYEIPYPPAPPRNPGESDADYLNRVKRALQEAFCAAVDNGSLTPEVIYEGEAPIYVGRLPHDRRRPPDFYYQGEAPVEFGPGLCSAAVHTGIFAETFVPPVWNYYLYPYSPVVIKPGDTMMMTGEGITNATVNGDAVLMHSGSWQVKEVTSHYVVFEATSEAIVAGPISGFLVIAPDSIPGFIHCEIAGINVSNQGMAIGPAAIWDNE